MGIGCLSNSYLQPLASTTEVSIQYTIFGVKLLYLAFLNTPPVHFFHNHSASHSSGHAGKEMAITTV